MTTGSSGIGISSVAGAATAVISASEGRVATAIETVQDENASAGDIIEAQFIMADYNLRVNAGTNLFNSYQQALRSTAQNIN